MDLIVDEFNDDITQKRSRTLYDNFSNGESLLLYANASNGAFTQGYQPLIDFVKRSLATSLAQEGRLSFDRFSAAIEDMSAVFREMYPSSHDLEGPVYCIDFVAIVIIDDVGYLAWIGSPQAKLCRHSRCVAETTPHVMAIPNSGDPSFMVNLKSLTTHAGSHDSVVDMSKHWRLNQGDLLVIADHRLFARVADDEILKSISMSRSPAKDLVELAQGKHNRFAEAALVAKIR